MYSGKLHNQVTIFIGELNFYLRFYPRLKETFNKKIKKKKKKKRNIFNVECLSNLSSRTKYRANATFVYSPHSCRIIFQLRRMVTFVHDQSQFTAGTNRMIQSAVQMHAAFEEIRATVEYALSCGEVANARRVKSS